MLKRLSCIFNLKTTVIIIGVYTVILRDKIKIKVLGTG